MCRNIKPLFNFDPPASQEEIHAASLQFIRKVSGYNNPSKVNQKAFDKAVNEFAKVTQKLFDSLSTQAKTKDREVEKERARKRSEKRFSKES